MNFDIYEEVTARIIKQLEGGVIPWHKPWKVCGTAIRGEENLRTVAFNRISRTAYSALNQMLLSKPGEYASFKQWNELGGKIRKGSKAEIVVFWKLFNVAKKIDESDPNSEERIVKIPHLRYYQVFHIDDVEGVEPLTFDQIEDPTEFDPVQEAEDLIDEYSARERILIGYGGNNAFYSPAMDRIQLPERFQFGKKSGEFYSTAFHEIVHSTGAKDRLDHLSQTAFFGNHEYSKEELVAEIGAAGILNLLGIETDRTFTNSAAYIQSWLRVLKNDKKMIVSASARAKKALRYIINGKEEEEAAI